MMCECINQIKCGHSAYLDSHDHTYQHKHKHNIKHKLASKKIRAREIQLRKWKDFLTHASRQHLQVKLRNRHQKDSENMMKPSFSMDLLLELKTTRRSLNVCCVVMSCLPRA